MRRNCRFDGIKSALLIAAAILVLPALGSVAANAQRRPADDSDVFKTPNTVQGPERPNLEPDIIRTNSQQKAPQGNIGHRGMVGSPVPGIPIRSDSVSPVGTAQVTAGPISNCVNNGGGGITCDIFETDASGNPSDISNVISLPTVVTGGYLVLKHNPSAPDSDQSQWSDVLVFAPTVGNANTVQLFSAGCNTSNPNDRSCFPSFATVSADPDSGFINQTVGSVTVFTATPNIYNIYSIDDNPPNRPFTLATSVGTVDEDSMALAQERNFTTTFLPLATGAIHVRYSITAVDDIARFCPATQSIVRVRFRNTDNTGTVGQVAFEIHQTNITSGGNNVVYSFTSNGRGVGASFTSVTDTPALDFDFTNNIYWIEATLFRSDPNALADLGSIQIWEGIGTGCP